MRDSWINSRHTREARSRSRSPSVCSLPETSNLGTDFQTLVRRSFTPTRELVRSRSAKYVRNYDPDQDYPVTRLSYTPRSFSPYTPSAIYSPMSVAIEDQPLRKYDVFSLRTWSYPIWKHLHEPLSRTPRLRRSNYVTAYTPPIMAMDYRPLYSSARRGYSGFSYMAGEHSFYLADVTRSLRNLHRYQSAPSRTPWYRTYQGDYGLRHFGGYRPRRVTYSIRSVW